MADTYRWVGRALDVKQIDTVTIGGTPAATDTVTLTIGQKDLIYTVGTDITTTQVASGVKAMIAGEADPGTGDGTRNALGTEVAEFREVTATVSGAVVTVTANTAGKPFTLTAAGGQVAGTITATRAEAQACTGKHWVDNADNWYNETDGEYEVPTDVDAEGGTLVFDQGNVDVLYALTTLTNISPADVYIRASYEGKIGLAATNTDDSTWTYPEYRSRKFLLGVDSDAQPITVAIGQGDGAGSSRLVLSFGDCEYYCTVMKTATREVTGVPSLLLSGSHADNTLDVVRGDVGAGLYEGDVLARFARINVSYLTSQTTDSKVLFGDNCNLDAADIKQSGGELTIMAATSSGTIELFGGTCTILDKAHASIKVSDATLKYHSAAAITALYLYANGTADFRYNTEARTVTATEMSKGSALYDSFESVTFTDGIQLKGCKLSDVTIDVGYERLIDIDHV